jgi:thioredoxin 1
MIDFWVTDCQPCRVIAPMMEEIAKRYAGRVFVGKIRADENQKTTSYFNVTSAPTILIMKDGCEVDRITLRNIDKSRPKESIEGRLKQHLE